MAPLKAIFCLPAVLAVVALVGCTREPPRGTAKGRVTYQGGPVTGAVVFFENASEGVAVTANLETDGAFEIKSYKGAGLPPGSYRVAVSPGRVMESAEEIPLAGKGPLKKAPPAAKIPERYHKTATSGLQVEIKEGENPVIEIELKD